jgi:hypothetical protein
MGEQVEIVGQLTQWVTKFTYKIYFPRGIRKIPMTSLSNKYIHHVHLFAFCGSYVILIIQLTHTNFIMEWVSNFVFSITIIDVITDMEFF